jgi:hypothetical protein
MNLASLCCVQVHSPTARSLPPLTLSLVCDLNPHTRVAADLPSGNRVALPVVTVWWRLAMALRPCTLVFAGGEQALEVDVTEDATFLRFQLYTLTDVPPERQEITIQGLAAHPVEACPPSRATARRS